MDVKEQHTEHVCVEIVSLGRELGLSDKDLYLAEVMALFHDVGRFEQFARHRTFSDHVSENHAALGVQVLKKQDTLARLDDPIRSLVLCAILYHNGVSAPAGLSERESFFTRLLRDADKLDIWRVLIDYYRTPGGNGAVVLDLPDTDELSPEVLADLSAGRAAKYVSVRTLNDFKLAQVGWVYDINFAPTFQRIYERHYLEAVGESLPQTEQVKAILNVATTFLHNRVRK